ncbi:hypothetical protein [Paenibacillus sp. P46E]|uniref:hypothetical protein n=1 Tax=Paenibacillus sp. P46E TaxID=1349436 RepID=UPI00093A79D0|nr:hypothetical protein [Paenibacillus sp. P46E]OKP94371.1 hypothetical protein A3849_29485 [Paenibacillus sp. P46E]
MNFDSIATLSPKSEWKKSLFNDHKKEKNYEKLMNDPKSLGQIIANKSVKDIMKNIKTITERKEK